jgi:hypothetical protein
MSLQCPRCISLKIASLIPAIKIFALVGTVSGVARGASTALAGGQTGSAAGTSTGPLGITLGSLSGAFLGGLACGVGDCALGAQLATS